MERIKTLLARYSQTAFLFFMGLILIIYLALGTLYLQQAPQQRQLQDQITKLNMILRNPLPSVDALKAEYDAVNHKLAPMADSDAIAMLVSLAQKSGIDITEGSGKFQVPVASHSSTTVGGDSYQLLSFRGIYIQGDRDKVMAFISVLDSGTRLENMVLTSLTTDELEVVTTGEEAARREEFRSVIAAVATMMKDNALPGIPNPMSFSGRKASNHMGDDPDVPGFEGFPDITTTAADKGYTGNATPKNGYLLYQNDKISSDNTTLYTTVDYFPTLTTTYYYTAEKDGTVRQWSGPNAAVATEYPDSKPTKIEVRASVDVDIYFKPR